MDVGSENPQFYWLQSIHDKTEPWHLLTKLTDSLAFFIVFEGKYCKL